MPQEEFGGEARLTGVLVFSKAFDLGGRVEDLANAMKSIVKHTNIFEVVWCPGKAGESLSEHGRIGRSTEQGRELIDPAYLDALARRLFGKSAGGLTEEEVKKMVEEMNKELMIFRALTWTDEIILSKPYLREGRYCRAKLPEIKVRLSEEFSFLSGEGEVNLEAHILVHELGVAVVSFWLPFSNLTVDQVIELDEKFVEAAQREVLIGKEQGAAVKGASINALVLGLLAQALHDVAGLHVQGRSGVVSGSTVFALVGDWDSVTDALGAMPRELYGVLAADRGWRGENINAVREELLRAKVSTNEMGGWFVGVDRALMLVTKGRLQNFADLAQSVGIPGALAVDATDMSSATEFLLVMDELGDVYSDLVRKVLNHVYREHVSPRASMRSSDVADMDRLLLEVEDALREERNISFMRSDPQRAFVEAAKDRWGIKAIYAALEEDLDRVRDIVHAWYQERQASDSAILGALFGFFNVLLVMDLVWGISTRFRQPLLSLYATLVAGTAAALVIVYIMVRYDVLETLARRGRSRP